MKVVAINGSPRKNGNTAAALRIMGEELEKDGITTEIIDVGGEAIRGCMGCGYCKTSENNQCVFKEDLVNATAQKMREADGLILGAPTYYGGIPGTMKCFLDRAFYSSASYFQYKAATAVAVVRRTGGIEVLHQLKNFLELVRTVTPPSQYWMVGYGMQKGELLQDEEGVQTIRHNARSLAWVLKMLQIKSIDKPVEEDRVYTNFVR